MAAQTAGPLSQDVLVGNWEADLLAVTAMTYTATAGE